MIDEIRQRHRSIAAEVCEREGALIKLKGEYYLPFFEKEPQDLTDEQCVAVYANQLAHGNPRSIVDPTVPILSDEQQAEFDRLDERFNTLRAKFATNKRLLQEIVAIPNIEKKAARRKKQLESENTKISEEFSSLMDRIVAIEGDQNLSTEGLNVWCTIREHLDRLYSDELKERAIAFLTCKSTETQPESELPKETVKQVELVDGGIMVCGKFAGLTDKQAKLMRLLIDTGSEWISLAEHGYRSRDIQSLPKAVEAIIDTQPGAGTRIKPQS